MMRGITEVGHQVGPWTYYLDDETRAVADAEWLSGNQWAGVISRHTTASMARTCVERNIPLIDMNDTPVLDGVPKIRPANLRIGQVGAEHLLDAGFRNFAFCSYDNEEWAQERCAGFVQTIERAGHDCAVNRVPLPGVFSPEWDVKALRALAKWLTRLSRPTAIMACHDMLAMEVSTAVQQAGFRVPEDFAVLGANNDVVRCELSTPPLSSVAANPTLAGRRAAEALSRLMAGEPLVGGELRIDPAGVVVRHSSDILAVADKGVAAALRFIRENACKGVRVGDVLPHAAMSRAQIERKFREHLGRSPQAEIRRVQIMRLRQLLEETELPLKQIAEMAGFRYMEYMSHVFKREIGLSPGAYRRQFRP